MIESVKYASNKLNHGSNMLAMC